MNPADKMPVTVKSRADFYSLFVSFRFGSDSTLLEDLTLQAVKKCFTLFHNPTGEFPSPSFRLDQQNLSVFIYYSGCRDKMHRELLCSILP